MITDGNASIHVNNDSDPDGQGRFAIFRGGGDAPFLEIFETSEGTPQMAIPNGIVSSAGGGFRGQSDGSGPAVRGFQTGTGRAGVFEIENPGSSASVLQAETNGTGLVADLSASKSGDPRGNPEAHVAHVENASSNDNGGDVLALQVGEDASNVGLNSHFISFYDRADNIMGTVEGNGAGGIEFNSSGAVAERMDNQRARIAELEAENKDIQERLAALEAGHSPSAVAGMTGPTARLLLAFLLGGLFGAGLLWRRRA